MQLSHDLHCNMFLHLVLQLLLIVIIFYFTVLIVITIQVWIHLNVNFFPLLWGFQSLDPLKLVPNSPFCKHNPIQWVTFFLTNKALNFGLVYEAHVKHLGLLVWYHPQHLHFCNKFFIVWKAVHVSIIVDIRAK